MLFATTKNPYFTAYSDTLVWHPVNLIFCPMIKEKIREERIFEIVHCPIEGRAKLHHLCQPNGLVGQC